MGCVGFQCGVRHFDGKNSAACSGVTGAQIMYGKYSIFFHFVEHTYYFIVFPTVWLQNIKYLKRILQFYLIKYIAKMFTFCVYYTEEYILKPNPFEIQPSLFTLHFELGNIYLCQACQIIPCFIPLSIPCISLYQQHTYITTQICIQFSLHMLLFF